LLLIEGDMFGGGGALTPGVPAPGPTPWFGGGVMTVPAPGAGVVI